MNGKGILFNVISKMTPSTNPQHPRVSRWSGQDHWCVTEGTWDVNDPISSTSDNKLALTPFGMQR